MSNTLVAKEIRTRIKAAIAAGAITVDAGKGPVPVTLLACAPAGWVVPDRDLPAIYVFSTGEDLDYGSLSQTDRDLSLAVALMVRGSGDPMDQLDDIQLAVERAILAAGLLGIAQELRLRRVEIARDKGAVILSTRILNYAIVYGVTPDDPSL
jgi:hypothetical protein